MCARQECTPLDELDRAILQLLQRDARNAGAVAISEKVDVTDSTVRNRINDLERQGVIEGYAPIINYERAGYQLQIRFTFEARSTRCRFPRRLTRNRSPYRDRAAGATAENRRDPPRRRIVSSADPDE